jgi:hypothetical protein
VETAGGTEQVRLYGKVAPEESRVFKVNVGLDGAVRDVAAVTTGSQVRKDQLLVTFSTPEVRQPFGSYVTSLDLLDRETKTGTPTQVAAAGTTKQLMVDRLLTLGVSPCRSHRWPGRARSPTHIMVTSPIDGFVVARNVSAGEKFEKTRGTVPDRRPAPRVDFRHVAADDVPQVRPGTIGTVMVPAARHRSARGGQPRDPAVRPGDAIDADPPRGGQPGVRPASRDVRGRAIRAPVRGDADGAAPTPSSAPAPQPRVRRAQRRRLRAA